MNSGQKSRFSKLMIGVILPVLVTAVSLLGARALVASKPDAARLDPGERAVAVEVLRVAPSGHTVEVEAMGTVVPARRVELRAQVGGRVMRRHPALEAGGRVAEGDVLLEIERDDYMASLADAESVHAQMLLNEALELQRQSVAADEWRRSGQTSSDEAGRTIALREPHVEAARRAAAAAREGVERAKRNLERTVVRAPFDGIVLVSYAEAGSVLAAQSPVAAIAATDVFHVEAALPMDSLGWLNAASDGVFDPPPVVRITVSSGGRTVVTRAGRAVRLLGELTRPGLMAGLLVAVDDPLNLESGMLPLGAYARCVIEGRQLRDVYVLPRSAFRDGGKIWIAGRGDRLEIAAPGLVWQGPETVLLSDGLDSETRVITTALPSAIPGMLLQVLKTEGVAE